MKEELQATETPQAEEKKEFQRVPAPVQRAEKPKKRVRWWQALAAVGIAAFVFLGGYLTCWASLDSQMHTLLDVKKKIQKEYYQEISDETFYRAIFGAINDELLDDYSEYMTPEEFAASISEMEGNRSGIGLVFTTRNERELHISRVCGNSPAEAAGILAGEVIVGLGRLDGEITPCTKFDELSAFLEGFAELEEFNLQIAAHDGQVRTIKISKQAYVENYVFYRTKDSSYTYTAGKDKSEQVPSGAPLSSLPADTAYIRIIQFTGNVAEDFDMAMKQFKADGKKNLVLDLRENGGGYLDAMQSIAGYFCKTATEKKPVVAVADYGERRDVYKAYGNYYHEYFAADSRICVLADSGSASASECLIGCMLDYGAVGYADICLAERAGIAKTFGKGIMQETHVVNLFKQDALKLTTAEIRWPKTNTSIHGRGVLPEDGALTVSENFNHDEEATAAFEKLGLRS